MKNGKTLSPVFLIGCGRSGTTILGKTLSKHPKIKYLNERRDIWHKAYPEFNVWGKNIKNSKLYADKKDMISENDKILKNLLFKEQVLSNATVLLEKLPINNFRLNFLEESFKNARYIYITRNGLEVAKSIEKIISKGRWNRNIDILKTFNVKEKTNYKGMWEWKLSIKQSHQFFKNLNRKRFIHLSYKDLVDCPFETIKDIFDFLQLEYTEGFVKKICSDIKRNNSELKKSEDMNLHLIGGELLEKSISNEYQI